MSTTTTVAPATLDDLMRYNGKAELIDGKIVAEMPSGFLHARASARILSRLMAHITRGGVGEAFGDALGYAFDSKLPSGRQSISPDVSSYSGPSPSNLEGFIYGAPDFAVEVRSASDYGPKMNAEYEAKRKDYFFAGTLVVWDVDPRAKTVTKYAAADPVTPVVFAAGQVADAEPAVPGWTLAIDTLFA